MSKDVSPQIFLKNKRIILPNGSRIFFRTTSQEDSLRGVRFDLIIIDQFIFFYIDELKKIFSIIEQLNANILACSTSDDFSMYEERIRQIGENTNGFIVSF
jgi:thymidine kinase